MIIVKTVRMRLFFLQTWKGLVIAVMKNGKYIDLIDLYFSDFEISDIFAMRQMWKNGVTFHMSNPRKTSAFIFLNKCKGVYTDSDGESFTANEKSIVCLPQGSIYTCLNYSCSETVQDAIYVGFNVKNNDKLLTFGDSPFLIKDVNIPISADIFSRVVSAFEAAVPSPVEIKSSFYELLAHIGKEKAKNSQRRFSCISAGIEILETNPLLNISIEEISDACNVTPCYFRRLFKEYSGKSPIQYRTEQKLNMAKRMLENGESSLSHIAEALNFESASYFCRVFKKHFGITPGNYRDDIEK